ncbi:UPF0481 protein At3g47200-like [Arachis duranensis]|uniref:UPF0481 protein At3g47200-like n=1 Tax=Arachis duranensis TaxID=130453 RepID=A0A6P4CHE1_ARADU|nr:UPF0481 protein At3g47200-like [Arachis duranensis]
MNSKEEYRAPQWLRQKWELLEETEKRLTRGVNIISWPKLQRIPHYMTERVEFRRYYEPQILSLGPFHLAKRELLQGTPYKVAWTAMYVKHTNQPVKDLFQRIHNHDLNLLKRSSEIYKDQAEYETARVYGELENLKDFLAWLLVLDGCSLLQLMEKSENLENIEQELWISIDKLVRVHQDVLILDNQIPFQVLRLLCNDEVRLEKCLHNFLQVHGIKTAPKLSEGNPIHLLDYLRKALLMRDLNTIHKEIEIKIDIQRRSLHLRRYRIGTIRELMAAGIRVRKHSHNSVYPTFKDGMLELPELIVDGSTAHIFLNLVAYEMCPTFRNQLEISSFLVFMSSLIDQPEDVKELRLAGIIINELASDKEVADLFNKMDSVLVPETPLFAHIRDQIHTHFESKRGKIKILTWMGEAYNTFFRSPWTVIALLAATLGLLLTFIQTWFAIHPTAS